MKEKIESNLDKVLIARENKGDLVLSGESRMITTLEELKKIMKGIIGSFIVDENGEVAAKDLPEQLEGKAEKISRLIFYVTSVMKATRPFERIITDSGEYKIIAMLVKGRILVVIAERNINLPLLKLISNVTKSKLKENKSNFDKPEKVDTANVNKLCNLYDDLYEVAAKKLYDIFGAESADMFNKKLVETLEDHPILLRDVGFGSDGRPKIAKVKMNAANLSKDELITGLEDLLVTMLEAIKDTAGAVIADKAIDEIIILKGRNKQELSL